MRFKVDEYLVKEKGKTYSVLVIVRVKNMENVQLLDGLLLHRD